MRVVIVLLLTMLASAAQAMHEGSWQRAFEQMFSRDTPRRFARTPEDYLEYLEAGQGFYTQIAATSVYQHTSSTLTERDDLLNVAYDFGGAYELLDPHDDRVSGFSWWLRGGQPLDAPQNANLSRDIGAVQDCLLYTSDAADE